MLARLSRIVAFAALAAMLIQQTSAAGEPEVGNVGRGRAFVIQNCSVCHAVGRTGASPYAPAPPFRTLHERYNVEGLAEALAEGIVVAHHGPRQMPLFMLSPDEIDDLIAYLKSLESPPRRTGLR